MLQALATDPSVTVRASLALNPALPEQVTAMLAADTDARVRTILSRKLAALTPEPDRRCAAADAARRRRQPDGHGRRRGTAGDGSESPKPSRISLTDRATSCCGWRTTRR